MLSCTPATPPLAVTPSSPPRPLSPISGKPALLPHNAPLSQATSAGAAVRSHRVTRLSGCPIAGILACRQWACLVGRQDGPHCYIFYRRSLGLLLSLSFSLGLVNLNDSAILGVPELFRDVRTYRLARVRRLLLRFSWKLRPGCNIGGFTIRGRTSGRQLVPARSTTAASSAAGTR
jgi:hypothetical protein